MHAKNTVVTEYSLYGADGIENKHRLDGADGGDGRECTKNAVEKRIREIESETPALFTESRFKHESRSHGSNMSVVKHESRIGNDCH